MLFRLVLMFFVAWCAASPRALAFSLTGARWAGTSATLQLQLGPSPGLLLDGFASWGESAEDALAQWNTNMGAFRFSVVRDSTASKAEGNRVNNVHFAGNIYGDAFGSGVLAVTLTYTAGSTHTETDVLFNSRLTWNSYRGALRYSNTAVPIYDFHRVALHEFGHALGLDHPDENGQSVSALMNSRITSLDTLTADDINGARALYGAPASSIVAPTVTSHPASVTVTAGQGASLTVSATGTAPITYQWFKGNVLLANRTATTLAFSSTATTDSGTYVVVVTNPGGAVSSAAATLTVNAAVTPVATTPTTTTSTPPATTTPTPAAPSIAPSVTSHPADQSVPAGANATFSVAATGTALSYQWRKNGVAIAGATATSLTLTNVQAADAATYSAMVWNSTATTTSGSATLTVLVPPTITSHPASQSASVGARVVLNVAASGAGPLAYQWRRDGVPLAAATNATLTLDAVQPAHAGDYVVIVSNSGGSSTSQAARLSVTALPVIEAQPVAQSVRAGERATLTVSAAGSGSLSYQWFKDGVAIPGATTPQLTFEPARPVDVADYAVRVTNAAGSIISQAAGLTVKFSRLMNLSTRGFVPSGGALTPGFYIRGAQPKSLLVRGVGPTLSLFGVGTALGQAKLELIAQDSLTIVASNNDWGGARTLSDTFASVGAFPLAADSKDAAVHTSLVPRGYTARITPGDATMSGITLAEIYDVEAIIGSSSQLTNVSTLGFVGTGENVLTAGFVISGNAPKRLLIRAVGPGLANFGVGDFLRDPQLGVIPLGRNEPSATNDDWPDVMNVRSAFEAAGAFALASASKDAALVITLEPGAYTVIVSGTSSSAAGNALVEIYDLDP